MIRRNLDTPENREFWAGAELAKAEVETWPEWKKGKMEEKIVPPTCLGETMKQLTDHSFLLHLEHVPWMECCVLRRSDGWRWGNLR